jgi:hypothetical protein
MKTLHSLCVAALMAIVPIRALLAESVSPARMSDAALERVRLECEQRCDLFFRSQSGKPLVKAPIEKDWGGRSTKSRGDFTRNYNQSILLFAARVLHLNEQLEEANAALREMCEYHLERPQTLLEIHSFQDVPRALVHLCGLYGPEGKRVKGLISPDTHRVILKTLWAWASQKSKVSDAEVLESQTWTTISSENHHANLFSSCWASSMALARSEDYRDWRFADGHTATEHAEAWTEYLRRYYLERGKKGMTAEVQSPSYAGVTLSAAYGVYELAEDPLLKHRAGAYIALWWALWAQHQIDGVSGGGKARCYPANAPDGTDTIGRISWYVMGRGIPEFEHFGMVPFLTSSWRMPDGVRDLALDVKSRGNYEVRERRPGLLREGQQQSHEGCPMNPEFGGIVRYGYCTPEFILGSLLFEARPTSDWAQVSSQNRWHGAVFRGATDARIFPYCESLHSSYNAQWSAQDKGTLIAQKLKASKGTLGLRVWFSKEGLSVPVKRGDWFFSESEGARAAVRVVSGEVTMEQQRTVSIEAQDRKKGEAVGGGFVLKCSEEFFPVILEVALKADFPTMESFQEAVLGCPLKHAEGCLSYTGLGGGEIRFFTDQTRPPEINGRMVNYAPAKVYDSPFIQSEWDSGVVTIQKGARKLVLDFNKPEGTPGLGDLWIPLDVDWAHPAYVSGFENPAALQDWRMEGGRRMGVENGRLVLDSEDPGGKPKAGDNHLVCWLNREMPADFLLEFGVRPEHRNRGLNIVFFNARGVRGESVFDPGLRPRTGVFEQYHSGDLNNYHISYWAGERGTAHIRKNAGFHLVSEGREMVAAGGADAFQKIRVYKRGGSIRLMVDDRVSAVWEDDGKTFGPVWTHSGWMGLRQMAHSGKCEYDSVKVWPLRDGR